MRDDIVGPLRRVALDWTPDWTRERTLDSGPWTTTGVIHGPGIRVLYTSGKKRRAGGLRVRVRERLKYF